MGIDAGGLTRDFYIELSRAMFVPDYSLFTLTSNGVTFHPNNQSHVNPEHLNFFKFIGRMIGKAIFDNHLLELQLSKPLYKMMVGEDLTFDDLNDFDNDFYRSYVWIMKQNAEGLGLTFAMSREYFGRYDTVELVENGSQIDVTNENKIKYLEAIGYYQMYQRT
jgi:E3 ubiquitin-protein ligase HUWE1